MCKHTTITIEKTKKKKKKKKKKEEKKKKKKMKKKMKKIKKMKKKKKKKMITITVVCDHFLANIWNEIMILRRHSSVYENYHWSLLTRIFRVCKCSYS